MFNTLTTKNSRFLSESLLILQSLHCNPKRRKGIEKCKQPRRPIRMEQRAPWLPSKDNAEKGFVTPLFRLVERKSSLDRETLSRFVFGLEGCQVPKDLGFAVHLQFHTGRDSCSSELQSIYN